VLDIANYTRLIQVFLGEAAKYLLLLLFTVLAVRLWRHVPHTSGARRQKSVVFALVVTFLAGAIGYGSIRHSLGRLNFHYGMDALTSGNVTSALGLFQSSVRQWKSADAIGGEGICLLLMGQTNIAFQMLGESRAMRHGHSKFEDYYQGIYFFYRNQWNDAVPLLESASTETAYRWNVTELIAVIELEKGNPQNAGELMKPYEAAPVVDYTEAYILASLDVRAGDKAKAKELMREYNSTNVPPFWKSRLDKLNAELQTPGA
jgi:hypothetical protein